jgi:SAM-dependent methyltransferase
MENKSRWQQAYNSQPPPDSLEGGIRQFNGYRHPRLYAMLTESLQRATRTWQGYKILDAGCGSGDTGAFLAAHNHVTGLDFSQQMVGYARQHYERVLVGDVERLPFPANHFDGLLAVGVWQCLPSGSSFIEEVARVLRPGGQAVLGWVLNRDYVLYRRGLHFRLDPSVTLRLFTAEEIPYRLAAVGLRMTTIYAALFPLMVLASAPSLLRPVMPAFTIHCERT